MTTWLKLWLDANLDGAVRHDLSAAERGVYYDLQLLAAKSGQGGYLATETGTPYSQSWIAARLNIDRRLLKNAVQKCTTLGLINDTPRGLLLPGFLQQQSDYWRQKKYRQEGQPAGKEAGDPDKYVKGKYGHMVRR